ncbi:MAG: DUF4271 domain-containing protein [Flavobacteriales bacterium]
MIEHLPNTLSQADALTWYLFSILLLFSWFKYRQFGSFLSQKFDALILFKPIEPLPHKTFSKIESFILLILQQVNYTLLLKFYFNFSSQVFFISAFLLSFLIAFRSVLINFLGFLFQKQNIARSVLYYISYFESKLFFPVLALVLLQFYFPTLVYLSPICLGFLVGIYLFLRYRICHQIFIQHRVSMFYIFLYFCCLEISPIYWGLYLLTKGYV